MNLSNPLPEKGVEVPVDVTFAGWKSVPYLALGSNNYAPLLRVFNDRLTLKVIRTHEKTYEQIEKVDVQPPVFGKDTVFVVFTWTDTPFTFTARVMRESWLVQLLEFLASKHVSLTPRALALADKTA